MTKNIRVTVLAILLGVSFSASQAFAADVDFRGLLQQGLLGAGVGAISAGTSGGKAGKGALIGAGTNIIGGALLSFLTGPSQAYSSQPYSVSQPTYYTPAPAVQTVYQPVYQQSYQQPEVVYTQPAYTYSQPQQDTNKTIIKQGLLGAGVGAISASTSGGKAGTGALVGAGTNIIGGALLDMITTPQTASAPVSSQGTHKHIIRKFDASGRVVSEEEFWA